MFQFCNYDVRRFGVMGTYQIKWGLMIAGVNKNKQEALKYYFKVLYPAHGWLMDDDAGPFDYYTSFNVYHLVWSSQRV